MKPGDTIEHNADWYALPNGATVWTPTADRSGPGSVLSRGASGRTLDGTLVVAPSQAPPGRYVLATLPKFGSLLCRPPSLRDAPPGVYRDAKGALWEHAVAGDWRAVALDAKGVRFLGTYFWESGDLGAASRDQGTLPFQFISPVGGWPSERAVAPINVTVDADDEGLAKLREAISYWQGRPFPVGGLIKTLTAPRSAKAATALKKLGISSHLVDALAEVEILETMTGEEIESVAARKKRGVGPTPPQHHDCRSVLTPLADAVIEAHRGDSVPFVTQTGGILSRKALASSTAGGAVEGCTGERMVATGTDTVATEEPSKRCRDAECKGTLKSYKTRAQEWDLCDTCCRMWTPLADDVPLIDQSGGISYTDLRKAPSGFYAFTAATQKRVEVLDWDLDTQLLVCWNGKKWGVHGLLTQAFNDAWGPFTLCSDPSQHVDDPSACDRPTGEGGCTIVPGHDGGSALKLSFTVVVEPRLRKLMAKAKCAHDIDLETRRCCLCGTTFDDVPLGHIYMLPTPVKRAHAAGFDAEGACRQCGCPTECALVCEVDIETGTGTKAGNGYTVSDVASTPQGPAGSDADAPPGHRCLRVLDATTDARCDDPDEWPCGDGLGGPATMPSLCSHEECRPPVDEPTTREQRAQELEHRAVQFFLPRVQSVAKFNEEPDRKEAPRGHYGDGDLLVQDAAGRPWPPMPTRKSTVWLVTPQEAGEAAKRAAWKGCWGCEP